MNRTKIITAGLYLFIFLLMAIMTTAAFDARAQLRHLEGLPDRAPTLWVTTPGPIVVGTPIEVTPVGRP